MTQRALSTGFWLVLLTVLIALPRITLDLHLPALPGMAELLARPRGAMIVELSGRRHCVAHAASPGYETYATGWHSLILQAF